MGKINQTETMIQNCEKCNGLGDHECPCCKTQVSCDKCDGDGFDIVCISKYVIPKSHPNQNELDGLKRDAQRCQSDFRKLCEVNPKAKDAYSIQLLETLKKLNKQAEEYEKES